MAANEVTMKVELDENATLPVRATPGSAGYDLYSAESGVVWARGKTLVATGVSVELPPNTVAFIKSRSGLSVKKDIEVGAGVIDSDYRGKIGVVLRNLGDEPFVFEKGAKIAQMVIMPIITPPTILAPLSITGRGAGGFGSTGV